MALMKWDVRWFAFLLGCQTAAHTHIAPGMEGCSGETSGNASMIIMGPTRVLTLPVPTITEFTSLVTDFSDFERISPDFGGFGG